MAQEPRKLFPANSVREWFGAELRHRRMLRGFSQSRLAGVVHFAAEMVAKVEKGERWPPRGMPEASDAALDTGGVLTRMWPLVENLRLSQYGLGPLAPTQSTAGARTDPFGRRLRPMFAALTARDTGRGSPTGGSSPVGVPEPAHAVADPLDPGAWYAGTPLTVERLVLMTAHESAAFADQPSNAGPMTVERLRDDVTGLARSFANTPRLSVFTHARWLRDRIFTLLDGRQRVTESRDLYFLAGATCGMLAEITEDLGYRSAAMTHAQTAFLCAKESGHPSLMAWIRGRQSGIAYYDGRPAQAVEYARRGRDEHAPTGTVAVWLPALEARAAGRLGDDVGTRAALDHARRARDQAQPSDLDEIGGILSFPVPKQHHYGAESYLFIGAAPAVVAEAEACLAGYRAGPSEERAFDNEAGTQVNLAVAHVLTGDVDAARDAVQQSFTIPAGLRTASLSERLRRLHGRLSTPDLRESRVAVGLRDQIEDFLAATGGRTHRIE